jgi:hypothetical protein
LAPTRPGRHLLTRILLAAATVILMAGPVVTIALSAAGFSLCAVPPL